MVNKLTDEIQTPKTITLRNNRLPYNNVDNIIQANNVEQLHKTKILNTSSPVQTHKKDVQNNNMSIPEYFFQNYDIIVI